MIRKVKKNDKKFKELADVADEDKYSRMKLETTIDELNLKIKSLRNQVEDSEKNVNIHVAKYRKVQLELDGAKNRADFAENQLSNVKLRSRLSVQRDIGLGSIDESNYNIHTHHDYISRSSVTPNRMDSNRSYGRTSITVKIANFFSVN